MISRHFSLRCRGIIFSISYIFQHVPQVLSLVKEVEQYTFEVISVLPPQYDSPVSPSLNFAFHFKRKEQSSSKSSNV